MKREASAVVVRVKTQCLAATDHAVCVFQERFIKNERMRANVDEAGDNKNGENPEGHRKSFFELWSHAGQCATNDPSSATAATGRADCNCDGPPPFAAAHG